ncbi:hypothetical protein XELAEV_18005490mg [Xenopus laevis]|uniref:GIY-YIG domain-containing protein n=1 Tax=Xenopus laevis TaxID=8355 RepID=A0A974I2M8_XENLA|nr:hypothetical protein XELAEV_18005490mg [Xenopus laevis]
MDTGTSSVVKPLAPEVTPPIPTELEPVCIKLQAQHADFDALPIIASGKLQEHWNYRKHSALWPNWICSNVDDRNKHLHSLRKTFVNQGYHPQVIDEIQIHRATQIPRDTLLDYKEKTENNRNYYIKIARDLQPMLHTDTRLKQIFPELPLLFYRQPPNLRKMIVRSSLPKTTKAGTFPSNSNRCETCKYILCKDQVAIPNTQKVYTILDHYACVSSNVVYMITCTRCSTGGRYIGETGQKLRTRMNHHRHKINTKSCDTPVGQHFCSQNHSLQDMQVLILKGNFKT